MKLILVPLFCIFCLPAFSQRFKNDTFSVIDQVNQSLELYDHFTGAQAPIYNGREYVPYTFEQTGSPFFDSDSLVNGDISYAGRVYHSIPTQYDVVRNQLVILNYDGLSKLFLQNDVVDSFHFLNHRFIRIKEDPNHNLKNTDFYEFLFNDRIRVVARRKKNFNDTFKEDDIVRVFYSGDLFYIYKGDTYYAVNNKRDVFNIFNDKRHEIKDLMRQQKIKFEKNNFGEALLTAARIYDQLMY